MGPSAPPKLPQRPAEGMAPVPVDVEREREPLDPAPDARLPAEGRAGDRPPPRRIGEAADVRPEEATLSRWMADSARVAWVEVDRPWAAERAVFEASAFPW